jgi:uncharacterized protein involved in outer membrane biogenesis
MSKILKFLLSTIAAIAAMMIILLIAVVILVNPNNLKSVLSKQFYQATGQHLVIKGDMNWTFYPWLSLRANNIVISNPKKFSATPFAKIQTIDVGVKLLPLLHQQIEVGSIYLKGMQLNLIKRANGLKNWQNLVNIASNKPASAQMQLKRKPKSNLSIAKLTIVDGKINYQNLASHSQTIVNHIQLKSRNINLNQNINLQLSAQIDDMNFSSDITANLTKNLLSFYNLAVGPLQAQQAQLKFYSHYQTTVIHFLATNAVLQGFNLDAQLEKVAALFNKQIYSQTTNDNTTRFNRIAGTFSINNDIARNNDLQIIGDHFVINGQGQTNLASNQLNYRLLVTTQNSNIHKLDDLQRILGGAIPLRATGALAKPNIYPDLAAITPAIALYYLQKNSGKIEKKIDNFSKHINGEISKQLDKLFN